MNSGRQQAQAALIFLHIPKAAGTTLYAILRREYGQRHTYTIDGGRVRESVEAFKALPPEARAQVRLLMGHMPFGLHAYLPHAAPYVTLLRDPVERIISHYYFIRRTPHHYLYEAVAGQGLSLHEYVTSGLSDELDNGQVRLLAGPTPAGAAQGGASARLARAEKNLAVHFAVVGLSERFDESLLLMRRALAWRHWPLYFRRNVAASKPSPLQVPAETLAAIRDRNALDLALYRRACDRFEEAVAAAGAGLEADMRRFQRLNRLYHVQTLPLRAALWLRERLLRSQAATLRRNGSRPDEHAPAMSSQDR